MINTNTIERKYTLNELKKRIDIALIRAASSDFSISKETTDKFRQSLYDIFDLKLGGMK